MPPDNAQQHSLPEHPSPVATSEPGSDFQKTVHSLKSLLHTDSLLLKTIQNAFHRLRSTRQAPCQPLSSLSAEDCAKLIAQRYAANRQLFPLWEAHGFHITPVHFYSPIPQVSALSEEHWSQPSALVGIDLNVAAQLAFLQQVCPRFRAEYDAFPDEQSTVPHEYYFNQMMFRSVDAEMLYCMIRHYRPQRILEVGSGFSTYVAAAAVQRNRAEGSPALLTAVEPYPHETLRHGFPGLHQLLSEPVQTLPFDTFTTLTSQDILFIDSSHVLHLDSDVRFLLLEVLPRLQPGVIIHFHDIFLPCEYPRDWITQEYRFWNEQYVLQAFLTCNKDFEVLWAGSYMRLHHSDVLQATFRSYDPATVWPGSFWLRRLAHS